MLLMNRLLRHCFVFGGLRSVDMKLPLRSLCPHFLRGQPKAEVDLPPDANEQKFANLRACGQSAQTSSRRSNQDDDVLVLDVEPNLHQEMEGSSLPGTSTHSQGGLRIKKEPVDPEEGAPTLGPSSGIRPPPPSTSQAASSTASVGNDNSVDTHGEQRDTVAMEVEEHDGFSAPSVQQSLLVMSGTMAGTNINLNSGDAACCIAVAITDGATPVTPAAVQPQPDAESCRRVATTAGGLRGATGRTLGSGEHEGEEQRHLFSAQDRRFRDQAHDVAEALRTDPTKGSHLRRKRDPNLDCADRAAQRAKSSKLREEHARALARGRPERRQVPSIARRDLDHHKLSRDEHMQMAYETDPLFNRRCDFCAGNYCSRLSKKERYPACGLYEDHILYAPTRRLCDYRRCVDPWDHQTSVCDTLHARCPKCGLRGHKEGCNLACARTMEGLRTDFEDYAQTGVFTRNRDRDLAWGWYRYPPGVKRDDDNPILSYARLIDLPVMEAIQLVDDACVLPDNLVEKEPSAQGRGEPHED